MRLLPRRLAPRLIVALTILVAFGCGISAWIYVSSQEEMLRDEKVTAADQLSRSITSATWHAMRAGRKEDAYQVMRTIATEPEVLAIRLFDKRGHVTFTTGGDEDLRLELGAEACVICHDVDPPRVRVDPAGRTRTLVDEDGRRRLEMVTPIFNEPACATTDCHVPVAESAILGVLDVSLDMSHADAQLARVKFQAVLITFLKVLLIGLFLVFFIHRFVHRPIRELIQGTRAVSEMDLDRRVEVSSGTELGDLGDAFDRMREQLRHARDRSERFTEELEHQVAVRTAALEAAQEQLIESDRLASLGQLSASMAHEVNNPISAVLNLSVFLKRLLTDDGIPPDRLGQFRRHLDQISDETARVGRIVTDLLAFSRRAPPRRAPADLAEIAERTLSLVRHRAELVSVELILEPPTGAHLVPCDRSQMEQVLLNLVLNAVEAIEGAGRSGTVTVRTGVERATDTAVLQVSDDGPGISPEMKRRIFDPFFSTKEGTKGAGLGLAVAYGIVDAHGGRLALSSREGKGTVFTVRLPLTPKPRADDEPDDESARKEPS